MKPEFSPDALRLFLTAQVRHAGNLAAHFPPERRAEDIARRNAERAEKAVIAKRANISKAVLQQAMTGGQPVMAAHAERLWFALGFDLVSMEIMLEGYR
ncbi:hypothetical protein [Ciceribacter ferrooxidans]|uniref:Uncharacterized protein n=1 Tax=Ciceribacter ferrooxidans TaxID=2509717 RepID=A0A4V1RPP3_9HYPH|nr:hypothetical protein [Ciceribacter ferrooxidans]RYC10057.1 hypothetical protein EUU22_18450 [Ciceribacter ferrooxidans]